MRIIAGSRKAHDPRTEGLDPPTSDRAEAAFNCRAVAMRARLDRYAGSALGLEGALARGRRSSSTLTARRAERSSATSTSCG